MDALETALGLLETAEMQYERSEAQDGNAYWRSRSERSYAEAAIYATVALAEAAQRQAAAVERRNELLEEANAHMRESSKTLNSSVMDLLNTVFKAATEDETE